MKLDEQLTTRLHPNADVHPSAELGRGVEIGPFCVVGADVVIGDNTRLDSHVVVHNMTRIGRDCRISSGSILGGDPQDQKYKGERSFLVVGDNNIIREYVTLHRATGEGKATVIGNNNMLMAYCHIGHNSSIGNNVIMANTVGVSGHCVVEDRVVFGGMVGVHQYCRIGQYAFLGGLSKVVQDIPPFMAADGHPAIVYDINRVGLTRAGASERARAGLRHAYKLLYRSNLNVTQALDAIEDEVAATPERDYLLEFIKNIKFGFGGRQLDTRRM